MGLAELSGRPLSALEPTATAGEKLKKNDMAARAVGFFMNSLQDDSDEDMPLRRPGLRSPPKEANTGHRVAPIIRKSDGSSTSESDDEERKQTWQRWSVRRPAS